MTSDATGGHGLRADDLTQLLDPAAYRVNLRFEAGEAIGARGAILRPLAQHAVARAEEAPSVAFLCDVATEELAGLNVDRVVFEDVVEEVGLIAGACEPRPLWKIVPPIVSG
jgi:hypothetical protein